MFLRLLYCAPMNWLAGLGVRIKNAQVSEIFNPGSGLTMLLHGQRETQDIQMRPSNDRGKGRAER